MASSPGRGAPSLSLRHGVRCVPDLGVNMEEVSVGTGEQVGFQKISSASRMKKAAEVFLSEEEGLVRRFGAERDTGKQKFSCLAVH